MSSSARVPATERVVKRAATAPVRARRQICECGMMRVKICTTETRLCTPAQEARRRTRGLGPRPRRPSAPTRRCPRRSPVPLAGAMKVPVPRMKVPVACRARYGAAPPREAAAAALVAPPLGLCDVLRLGRGGRLRRRVRIAEVKGDEAAAAVAADGLDAVEEQRVVEGDEGAARRLHHERRLRIVDPHLRLACVLDGAAAEALAHLDVKGCGRHDRLGGRAVGVPSLTL